MTAVWNTDLPTDRPGPGPRNSDRPVLRVLVVEDNRDAANTLARLVLLDGHAVEIAYDGAAALEAGGRFRPDVVLLDLSLPGIDGWQVATTLLADATARKKPLVIAVTGRIADADRRRSVEAGIALHMSKPANPEVLLHLLRRFQAVLS